jgi:hypothetical protein
MNFVCVTVTCKLIFSLGEFFSFLIHCVPCHLTRETGFGPSWHLQVYIVCFFVALAVPFTRFPSILLPLVP